MRVGLAPACHKHKHLKPLSTESAAFMRMHNNLSTHMRKRRIKTRKASLKNKEKRKSTFSRLFSLTEEETSVHEPAKDTLFAAMALIEQYGRAKLENLSPEEDAAIRIQRAWRITERLRQANYRRHQIRVRINSIVVYVFFLAAHFFGVISPLSEDYNFHFVNNLKGQLGEVEFNEADSPTWGKNFFHMATVQELHQWLDGPFKTFMASAGTYDGDIVDPKFDTRSYALGFGRIVGGVKISQIRSKRAGSKECSDRMMFTFGTSLNGAQGISDVVCYEILDAALENEDRESFGPPTNAPDEALRRHGNRSSEDFVWEGWNGSSTTQLRKGFLTEENVYRSLQTYPPPAYGVVLDPSNWTQTSDMIKYLRDAHYVDRATRVLMVDMLVYNPTIPLLAQCRMIVQLSPVGGALPTWQAKTAPLTPFPFTGGKSVLASVSELVIITFYIYFMYEEIHQICKYGLTDYGESADLARYVHVLNIMFFVLVWVLRIIAFMYLPEDRFSVRSDRYLDIRSYVETMVMSRVVAALNAFLSWFKLIAYLELSPQFAIVTKTLSRSAKMVAGFMVVFLLLLYSFAAMYTTCFSTMLFDYSTMTRSALSLFRALLGDVDFDELQAAHWLFGPGFYFLYVSINVFVVLNMLIAIISDAYSETQEELKNMPNIQLGSEIVRVLKAKFWKIPGTVKIYALLRRFRNASLRKLHQRRARRGNKSHNKHAVGVAAYQHRVSRIAFEMQEARDRELERESRKSETTAHDIGHAETLMRMEARLERMEKMVFRIAGVEHTPMQPVANARRKGGTRQETTSEYNGKSDSTEETTSEYIGKSDSDKNSIE